MKNFFKRYENGDRPLGSRLATMKIALSLLDNSKNNNFVETGTTRKNYLNCPNIEDRAADGGSTLIFYLQYLIQIVLFLNIAYVFYHLI
jgi:hypothetical protein